MDLEKLLEEASETEKEMLEDPESFDFSPVEDLNDDDVIEVAPENPWIDSASVDLENDNVEMSFSTQSVNENYVAVWMTDIFSLIESNGYNIIDGESSKTEIYYLVLEDDVFMYEEEWTKTTKERPLEAVQEASNIYRKAIRGEEDELDWGNDTDYVPTPKEEQFEKK